MRARRAAALAFAGLLAMTGCGSGEGEAKPDVVNYTQSAAMSIKIAGRHAATYRSKGNIVVLRASGVGDSPVLTVGTDGMVSSAEGFTLEAFSTIAGFDDDGDYVINPPNAKTDKKGLASNAYVTMYRGTTRENLEAGRYDQVAERCKVTIKKQGSEGKVVCPKLVEATTKDAISLSFEWKGTGPQTNKLPATTTTAST